MHVAARVSVVRSSETPNVPVVIHGGHINVFVCLPAGYGKNLCCQAVHDGLALGTPGYKASRY